jgi:hypothetical protein
VLLAEEAWEALLAHLSTSRGGRDVLDLFTRSDRDGDGYLDVDELVSGLAACGVVLSPRQARALLKDLDANGDGRLSEAEFLQAVEGQRSALEASLSAAWDSVLKMAQSAAGSRGIAAQFKIMDKGTFLSFFFLTIILSSSCSY